MRYGIVLPFEPIHEVIDLARTAEDAGWDGFFVGDSIWSPDPWVTLAAIAAQTERIRLGPLLTPVSRRRPWKLASESATLDQISNGRAILVVGMGALDTGFANLGEETDLKTRAGLLDEGLELVARFWNQELFDFEGEHYQVKALNYKHPAPVQQPRIPVWVVGLWPYQKSVERALRWDGWVAAVRDTEGNGYLATRPDHIREMAEHVRQHRTQPGPFDIIVEGESPLGDRVAAAEVVRPFEDAGATWWIESTWHHAGDLDFLRRRVEQGPPRE